MFVYFSSVGWRLGLQSVSAMLSKLKYFMFYRVEDQVFGLERLTIIQKRIEDQYFYFLTHVYLMHISAHKFCLRVEKYAWKNVS